MFRLYGVLVLFARMAELSWTSGECTRCGSSQACIITPEAIVRQPTLEVCTIRAHSPSYLKNPDVYECLQPRSTQRVRCKLHRSMRSTSLNPGPNPIALRSIRVGSVCFISYDVNSANQSVCFEGYCTLINVAVALLVPLTRLFIDIRYCRLQMSGLPNRNPATLIKPRRPPRISSPS